MDEVCLPCGIAAEASLIDGVKIFPIKNLSDLVNHVSGVKIIEPYPRMEFEPKGTGEVDISDIKGQEFAKRALVIAAAGGHNILMSGPPGSGKTMLAKAVASSTNSTFIEVVGSELVQKFIGEGAKLVKEIFSLAREKAPSKLINSGLYIIEPEVLDMIPDGFAMLEKDVFPKLAQDGKLRGFPFSGQWFDTGNMERLDHARNMWKDIDPHEKDD